MSYAEAGQAIRRAMHHLDLAVEALPVGAALRQSIAALRRLLEHVNIDAAKLEALEDAERSR